MPRAINEERRDDLETDTGRSSSSPERCGGVPASEAQIGREIAELRGAQRRRPPRVDVPLPAMLLDPVLLLYYICHGVRFVWDERKAAANLKKHGISFDEASSAFEDRLGAYYPDTLHENRFILIGYSRQQRLLYVVHAEVEVDAIRIISARKATRHEKARYEND